MCQVTDKLKLCSCSVDVSTLQNFWVYLRIVPGQDNICIGEVFMPYYLPFNITVNNKKRITRMLNKGNCFDFEMQPMEEDQLHLYFNTKPGYDSIGVCYSFKFSKTKWSSIITDTFDMMRRYDTYKEGKIENGLNRNIENGDLDFDNQRGRNFF